MSFPSLFFLVALCLCLAAAKVVPPACSVTYCGTNGSHAVCSHLHLKTTCALWAKTGAGIFECKLKDCTIYSCYFLPVYDNLGNPHCTPCHLHQASCKAGYTFYGPVNGSVGAVSRRIERPRKVIDTEKSIAASEKRSILPPKCSADFCSMNGALAMCTFQPKNSVSVISCYKFSRTATSREECDIFCSKICLLPEHQPVSNTGTKYCTQCLLKLASCASRYRIYGPVKPKANPALTECSMRFCVANGAAASCSIDGAASSCAKFSLTDEKREQCAFACILICVPEDEQPVDNNGKKYCSGCQLAQASCGSNFRLFAPKV